MHQLHKLGAIVSLSARSPLHRHYTIDDIERLYGAAMASDQVKLFMASEYPEHFIVPRHDWPVAFVTWALMSDDSRDAYVRQTRLLEGEDFVSGADLWVIDFVAPYGAVREIVRDVRADLSRRYPHQHAHWIRNNMTAERRLGRVTRERQIAQG